VTEEFIDNSVGVTVVTHGLALIISDVTVE
jgi:hypothetical protein